MGIENDIHLNSFESVRHKAMVNILFSYGWILERIKSFLAPVDLTPQQYNLLRILRRSFPEPLSTMQIRERMLDRMSDTSRIVDRLVAKQLVKKEVSPRDRRLVDITITEKGLQLVNHLDDEFSHMQVVMGNLTEEEAQQLSFLLDKLRDTELSAADAPSSAEEVEQQAQL